MTAAKYVLMASMDVDADHEAAFNEVYDREHVPNLLGVPGVLSIARYRLEPFSLRIGGEVRSPSVEGEPTYTAMYELEGPDVLMSEAWAEAIDRGRWPAEIRPFTKNRRHLLLERID